METKIESRVYRVEAFIIPKANSAKNLDSNINEIDDVKADKLKLQTSQIIEQLDAEENQTEGNKSNNAENVSQEEIDTELLESSANLNISDSPKKESINSFNEYQEAPDFETLIKSPELIESYSNQKNEDEIKSPSIDENIIFSSLKKCLVDFMQEEEQKEKIQTQSFVTEKDEEENNVDFAGSFKELIIKEIEQKIILGNGNEKKIEANEIEEKKPDETNTKKFTDFRKPFPKIDELIYDEPFVGILNRNPKSSKQTLDQKTVQPESIQLLSKIKYQDNNRLISKPPKRCSSLKSIDEGVEIVDTNFDEICYHGHKNGCTVAVQRPEDVSQEIFKDNWLQRLEVLRQREALLRDKEIALQSRERLLFKKEKELRILERMVKDKMKQAELYLKRCKNSQNIENVFDEKNIDSKSSEGSGVSKTGFILSVANADKRVPFAGESFWLRAPELKYDLPKENLKNPPSRNSFPTLPSDVKYGIKLSAYSSIRCKPKPKISYDDLDSTLSADVGDASFVVTSKKFDPVIFKKPAAFSRSASERRPKIEHKNVITKEKCPKHDYPPVEFEESKILRKVSENILVSQDKDTKFQNYGIIDNNVKNLQPNLVRSDEEDKKYGYLNLEVAAKTKRKSVKGLKNRPISWSAETDNWLQKKREAYNSANKKPVHNCDKENLELNSEAAKFKRMKKKSGKVKKFSIFR